MQTSTRFPARHCLTEADQKSVNKLRQLLGDMVPSVLPGVILEVRMDSAFVADEIVLALSQRAIQYQPCV